MPARVVITDIYNLATPLVRYDTGDLAIVDVVDGDGDTVTLVESVVRIPRTASGKLRSVVRRYERPAC